MVSNSQLSECIQRFEKEAGVLAVWLLGSAVTGRMRTDSDVDFAVLFFKGTTRDMKQEGYLIADLEGILARSVDLGVLSTQNLIYAHQAISEGQLVYNRAPAETSQFLERILALYFDLKRDRKVVEDAYCA